MVRRLTSRQKAAIKRARLRIIYYYVRYVYFFLLFLFYSNFLTFHIRVITLLWLAVFRSEAW